MFRILAQRESAWESTSSHAWPLWPWRPPSKFPNRRSWWIGMPWEWTCNGLWCRARSLHEPQKCRGTPHLECGPWSCRNWCPDHKYTLWTSIRWSTNFPHWFGWMGWHGSGRWSRSAIGHYAKSRWMHMHSISITWAHFETTTFEMH